MTFLNYIYEKIEEIYDKTLNYINYDNNYFLPNLYNVTILLFIFDNIRPHFTYITNTVKNNFTIYKNKSLNYLQDMNLIENINQNRINCLNYLQTCNFMNDIKYLTIVIIDKFFNFIIYVKLFLISKMYNENFYIEKVILYTDLNNNINVTNYFKNNNIELINRSLIIDMYNKNNLEFELNENIRLKIFFKFKNIDYVIYFPYIKYIDTYKNNDLANYEHYYLPLPIYNEEIINNYRDDIILPTYTNNYSKKFFYSLFGIECKNIHTVEINNTSNLDLTNYIEMIKTPFNDFGLLYDVPVKLIWLLSENNINLETFNSFYLKYLNMYYDEDTVELKEHYIKYTNEDIDKIIISDRVKDILFQRETYREAYYKKNN